MSEDSRGRVLRPDGGEVEMSDEDEPDDEGQDEQADAETQDTDAEAESEADEAEAEDQEETEDEEDQAETEEEAEDEQDQEEAEDEEDREETEDQEGAEDQEETEAQKETEDEGDDIPEEDEEREGVHSGGAEAVYEDDEASGVLHLDLDGLALDLLGLEVHLNEVVLDVSARPGDNNLLGNLLSSVTGLLDGLAASPLEAVKNALGKAKNVLGGFLPGWSGIKEKIARAIPDFGIRERLSGLLPSWEGIKGRLASIVPDFGGIRERISGAIPGWSDIKEKLAGLLPGRGEGEEGESPGILARFRGWIGEKLRGLMSLLPIEEIIATIVREVIDAVIQQVESAASGDGEDQQAEVEA